MNLKPALLSSAAAVTFLVGVRGAEPSVPKVGELAPEFLLKTLTGTDVKLSSLLKNGPVALVVLRGFPGYQCPICTTQVGELIRNGEAFRASKPPLFLSIQALHWSYKSGQ